jgi:hypothetical protein
MNPRVWIERDGGIAGYAYERRHRRVAERGNERLGKLVFAKRSGLVLAVAIRRSRFLSLL